MGQLTPLRRGASGFTLLELAIVVTVIGLLIGAFIVPFSAQVDMQRVSTTQKTIDQVMEALVGFALANDRLPCPAKGSNPPATTDQGRESFAAGGSASNGNCSNFFDGFVPGIDLGITPVDDQGFVLDAWNNRLRYAVSDADSSAGGSGTANGVVDYTAIREMRNVGVANLKPNVVICSTAPTAGSCPSSNQLTTTAVAVVYSIGPNGTRPDSGNTRVDESHNPNPQSTITADKIFVSHTRSGATAPNGEFDDIVSWLSPNILYSRLLAAGRL